MNLGGHVDPVAVEALHLPVIEETERAENSTMTVMEGEVPQKKGVGMQELPKARSRGGRPGERGSGSLLVQRQLPAHPGKVGREDCQCGTLLTWQSYSGTTSRPSSGVAMATMAVADAEAAAAYSIYVRHICEHSCYQTAGASAEDAGISGYARAGSQAMRGWRVEAL